MKSEAVPAIIFFYILSSCLFSWMWWTEIFKLLVRRSIRITMQESFSFMISFWHCWKNVLKSSFLVFITYWLGIMSIMIFFGLGNVMHAGLICHPNGEHGKIVNKNYIENWWGNENAAWCERSDGLLDVIIISAFSKVKTSWRSWCMNHALRSYTVAWIITDCNI